MTELTITMRSYTQCRTILKISITNRKTKQTNKQLTRPPLSRGVNLWQKCYLLTVTKQEAQLPKRGRATLYVSKFVPCFTNYGS